VGGVASRGCTESSTFCRAMGFHRFTGGLAAPGGAQFGGALLMDAPRDRERVDEPTLGRGGDRSSHLIDQRVELLLELIELQVPQRFASAIERVDAVLGGELVLDLLPAFEDGAHRSHLRGCLQAASVPRSCR
jgi:hypothetical protein